jgi:hypothetical protein
MPLPTASISTHLKFFLTTPGRAWKASNLKRAPGDSSQGNCCNTFNRFRKRAVAAYRRGGGEGLVVKPPLAVAISDSNSPSEPPAELANLKLDLSVRSSKVQPLFMPVFILEFPRFGANFRVFVCGCTGRVGGEAHFSPLKACAHAMHFQCRKM